jgi:hypothetical protein
VEEPTLAQQLAAIAGAEAAEQLALGGRFELEVDGVAIRVRATGEDSEFVELSAPYRGRPPAGDYRGGGIEHLAGPRPLAIELSPESDDDRRAKQSGISREVQTGDAAFDETVYVTSARSDRLVHAVLASSDLRRAVLTLFDAYFDQIVIDDDDANITARRNFTGRIDAAALAHAFATIANEVPIIEPTRRVRTGWITSALGVLVLCVPFAVGVALMAAPARWVLPGGLAGGLVGTGVGWLIALTQRGRSDSHVRRRMITFAAGAIGVEAGLIAAVWLALT